MSKKLAIKGHLTRGNEVIGLLEMLGGTNPFSNGMVIGNKATNCYYISEDTSTKYISWDYIGPEEIDKYVIFTLEEFLKKYPYKIGDKVYTKSNSEGTIIDMFWYENEILYQLSSQSVNALGHFRANELKSYKEEVNIEVKKLFGTLSNPAETKSHTVSLKDGKVIDNSIDSVQIIQSGKIVAVRFNTQNYENEVELQLDDYEIEIRDGKTYAVLKKPVYPKLTNLTECKEILGEKDMYQSVSGYKGELLTNFQRLLIFRDVYWKIAGEQMGLGKPWKPDWDDRNQPKYGIHNVQNNIRTIALYVLKNMVLVFPTEEMRDTFHENFEDLIKSCKELL